MLGGTSKGERVNVLALDLQDLPLVARMVVRETCARRFRQPGCCVDHVFAIIENKKKFLCSDARATDSRNSRPPNFRRAPLSRRTAPDGDPTARLARRAERHPEAREQAARTSNASLVSDSPGPVSVTTRRRTKSS